MVQPDVQAQADSMVLWVPPTGVKHAVCVRGRVERTIAHAVVNAIMAIVGQPVTETVGPVNAEACVAHARL
jgi:hypothetical protein